MATFTEEKTIPKVAVLPQDRVKSETKRAFYHITYQMTDADDNVYVGRTSGYGTPMELAKKRASGHHATKRGFSANSVIPTMAAISSKNSYEDRNTDPAYYFIRGAEDDLIKENKKQGKSGNTIMGISAKNKKKDDYRNVYIANDNSARELDNCVNCYDTKESVPLMPN